MQTLGLHNIPKIYLHLIINICNIHITKNSVKCNNVFNELSVHALHDNKIGKLAGALLPQMVATHGDASGSG